jgi:hypothetical protein
MDVLTLRPIARRGKSSSALEREGPATCRARVVGLCGSPLRGDRYTSPQIHERPEAFGRRYPRYLNPAAAASQPRSLRMT